MLQGYTIETLEIQGFRGYLEKLSHNFNNRSCMIFGPQGSGKSSTLNAIEWCLFGKIAYFKSAESKSDSELVNARANDREAIVKIRLVNGDQHLEIVRAKRINNRDTDVTISFNGKREEAVNAQETIFRTLGLTFDDFYRSCHLHQESINSLITDDPKMRDEAIDRLLGLDRIRSVIGSIPMQKINNSLAELTDKRRDMTNKLAGAIDTISAQVAKAENDVLKRGIVSDQISILGIQMLVTELQRSLNDIATESDVEPILISGDLTTEVIEKLVPKIRTFIRNSRAKVIEVTGVDELRTKQSEAIQLKLDSEKILRNKKEIEIKIKEIESKFGNIESIGNEIKETDKRIEVLKKDREELDFNAKLAKDALHFFEGALISTCPVCGQKITYEETKKHLEEVLEDSKGAKVREIDGKIEEEKSFYIDLDGKKRELVNLTRDLADLLSSAAAIESKVGTIAEKKIRMDEIDDFLASYLTSLLDKISESEKAFSTRNRHIEAAEALTDKIQAINNVLLKRGEYRAVDERSKNESEESKGLSEVIMKMENFKEKIDVLVRVLNEIQSSSATRLISQASEKMGSYYSRLDAHSYYNQLDISVTSKNVQGIQKNTYLIKAKSADESRSTHVSSRFSAGQLNCTALSIFLSLAEISNNKVGFIMLDDPSQSLDDEHVMRLSQVLSDLSSLKQVIVATQEDNLQGNLKAAVNEKGRYNEIKFGPWTKNGCRLENKEV